MQQPNKIINSEQSNTAFSYSALGLSFKQTREAHGVSQAALAKAIGTSQAHISKFERGLLNPTVGLLERIASHLNLQITITIE